MHRDIYSTKFIHSTPTLPSRGREGVSLLIMSYLEKFGSFNYNFTFLLTLFVSSYRNFLTGSGEVVMGFWDEMPVHISGFIIKAPDRRI